MSLVRNERLKLVATALNNTAVATIITAVIGPIVGILNGASGTVVTAWWVFSGILWFLAGIGLHLVGLKVLGRLKP